MCFLGKKEFVFEARRDSFLNAQVINADMKEGDRSAIRMGMKLMKRWLCFRVTAKLGNSKGQHCSWKEKKLFIEGSTVQKSSRRKRKKRSRKDRKVFYSHMNCRNASYV